MLPMFYLQGFHDIVSVILLVLEDDHIALALTEVVTRDYISDFMNADLKAMKMLYASIKASLAGQSASKHSCAVEQPVGLIPFATFLLHLAQYNPCIQNVHKCTPCVNSMPAAFLALCAEKGTNLRSQNVISHPAATKLWGFACNPTYTIKHLAPLSTLQQQLNFLCLY